MVLGLAIGIPFGWGFGSIQLPTCLESQAVAWFKNFNNIVTENSVNYIKDSIGERTDPVYYGQYLSSGVIDFNTDPVINAFDYTDPTTGNLVENVAVPANGLFTIPASGLCNLGTYPRTGGSVEGLLDFQTGYPYDRVDMPGDYLLPLAGHMSLKVWAKKETGFRTSYGGNILVSLGEATGTTRNSFVSLSGNLLRIQIGSVGTYSKAVGIPLVGLSGKVLDVYFEWDDANISNVKVNGTLVNTVDTTVNIFSLSKKINIGSYGWGGSYLQDALVWDVNINDEHAYIGHPAGNTDGAWLDTIGSLDGTVLGGPGITTITEYESPLLYTSFYPTCEKEGEVIHDIMVPSSHLEVITPIWDETLFGSDYLNQFGYVNKADSDSKGYLWGTLVGTVTFPLAGGTLVPLAKWDYAPIIDNNGEALVDSNNVIIEGKINI